MSWLLQFCAARMAFAIMFTLWSATLPLLRQEWGLTPAVDQQLGGLLMWIPGSLAYLAGIIGAIARWYSTPDEDVDHLAEAAACQTVPLASDAYHS